MFFGIGVYHPKFEVNCGTLWRSAFAFGASTMFTIGERFNRQASDTPKAWRHIPMFQFLNVEDLKKHLPYSTQLVGVEIVDNSINLPKFVHPKNCFYLLGAEDHGLPKSVIENCHKIISIPSRICLNVATAGSIVMYDRIMKEV